MSMENMTLAELGALQRFLSELRLSTMQDLGLVRIAVALGIDPAPRIVKPKREAGEQ